MTQTAVASRVPDWLKDKQAIAWYPPERILFVPQRKFAPRPTGLHLLDYADRAYPLKECDRPLLDHLNGVALFIPESGVALSVYRIRSERGTYVVSDGVKRAWLKVEIDECLRAARSLAEAFDGVVVTEEIGHE